MSVVPIFTEEAKEEAMRTMGVKSILRSITNATNCNLDRVAVTNINDIGAWLLEKDYEKEI